MTRRDEPKAGRRTSAVQTAGLALAVAIGSVAGSAPGAESLARTGGATGTIRIGTTSLVVELPVEPQAVAKGLSDRNAVRPGTEGMVFRADGEPGFTMAGMLFCLDFIWIAGDAVAGVSEDVCPAPPGGDPPVVYPPAPVTAVVETRAGWVAEHGVAAGDGVSPLAVAPRTVVRMVAKAARNGRFAPVESETIERTLIYAGIEPAPIVARMERATADGTVTKRERRRVFREVRTRFAQTPRDGSPVSQGNRDVLPID